MLQVNHEAGWDSGRKHWCDSLVCDACKTGRFALGRFEDMPAEMLRARAKDDGWVRKLVRPEPAPGKLAVFRRSRKAFMVDLCPACESVAAMRGAPAP